MKPSSQNTSSSLLCNRAKYISQTAYTDTDQCLLFHHRLFDPHIGMLVKKEKAQWDHITKNNIIFPKRPIVGKVAVSTVWMSQQSTICLFSIFYCGSFTKPFIIQHRLCKETFTEIYGPDRNAATCKHVYSCRPK